MFALNIVLLPLNYKQHLKPFLDWITALFFLLGLFPLFIFLCLVLGIYHHGSPFFKQERIGQNTGIFKIFKFKTLTTQGKAPHLLGVLRHTKIDELPQLINILKGEMSFVGPRPDIAGYYDQLKGKDRKILDLKPGITGLASLKFIDEEKILATKKDPKAYNDKVIFPEKVKINRKYREDISFRLDLKILFKTVALLVKKLI